MFVLTEIVNERDLFFFPMQDENYLAELREMFRRWLAEHEIGLDADRMDLNSTNCPPLTQFKEELLVQYYRECRESYSAAVGLFNSALSLAMVVLTNRVAKKLDEDGGIW